MCNLFLTQRTLPPIVIEWNQRISPPAAPAVQSQAPLLTCSSCWTAAHGINSSSNSWQPFSHPHTQWFISQLELTVSSQEYVKELRILLFQRALYKLPSRDVLKKENYYFFLYNNYICFKSLYVHDKVVCFSAGFSYSVIMWPRFAVWPLLGAYVAHFVFSRDVWIRTQRAAVASRRATNLASGHLLWKDLQQAWETSFRDKKNYRVPEFFNPSFDHEGRHMK